MKTKLILCVMLFSAGTLFMNAQPPRYFNGARQNQGQGIDHKVLTPEARANRMAQHLELTDAQKAQVLELCQQEDAKRKVNREMAEKLREEHRQKMADEQKAHDDALEKIIGAEKFKKWQADRIAFMQKANWKRRHLHTNCPEVTNPRMGRMEIKANRQQNGKENFTPEKRAARLQTELGLTDAEKEALVQLFTSEQKKIAEERKQKMEANRKSHEAEMEKIIGKEKMAKYKEIQNSRIENAKKNRRA